MSLPDDDLEQEGTTRDWRFPRISGINNVIEWGLSGNQLEEVSVQRCKDALKKHEGILSHLGLSVDIGHRIQSHWCKRDHSIVVEKAMIGSNSINCNWNCEDPRPSLDLRLGLEEIQEHL
jgi:hypothetical protein